jgi:hypothetical protein
MNYRSCVEAMTVPKENKMSDERPTKESVRWPSSMFVHWNITAVERLYKKQLRYGVCPNRCSSLKDLYPLAYGWEGTSPAKTHFCVLCGEPLERTSRWNWEGSIAVFSEPLIAVRRVLPLLPEAEMLRVREDWTRRLDADATYVSLAPRYRDHNLVFGKILAGETSEEQSSLDRRPFLRLVSMYDSSHPQGMVSIELLEHLIPIDDEFYPTFKQRHWDVSESMIIALLQREVLTRLGIVYERYEHKEGEDDAYGTGV